MATKNGQTAPGPDERRRDGGVTISRAARRTKFSSDYLAQLKALGFEAALGKAAKAR